MAIIKSLTIERLSVCLSVCPSVCPIIRPQQRRAAGLLLSAVPTGDLDRQWQAPCTQQQRATARNRSTALSSKCGQCRVNSRVDEAELRVVVFVLGFL